MAPCVHLQASKWIALNMRALAAAGCSTDSILLAPEDNALNMVRARYLTGHLAVHQGCNQHDPKVRRPYHSIELSNYVPEQHYAARQEASPTPSSTAGGYEGTTDLAASANDRGVWKSVRERGAYFIGGAH